MDANREYAQVIEQSNAQGQLIASYVFADERISQIRDGQRSTYHADGLGSISALSNDAGEQTDGYTYMDTMIGEESFAIESILMSAPALLTAERESETEKEIQSWAKGVKVPC